uniref:Coatomer alpha subunit, putative n=1 Tax=Theileria annulata TaxID=5874 RepID=A0A3B0MR36_THEAN
MLIKCKTKGTRVKGVVFHPRLHFLLASMHSGNIQMWDYLNSTLVEVFSEHEGPVRGIDFHQEQPLFVSGGDDTTVIVWDFTQRKKLFVLAGHLDYVRTVQFHTSYPWVMSSSDDQTIRIWNWQSRSCITVISGHNHYVMSSLFHPTENLIISSSLDHTARIWDITYLVEKKCSIKPPIQNQSNFYMAEPNSMGNAFEIEVTGVSDVICLHTLVGHSSGVNYAIFFGTNLAITAGDDCTVRIWRYSQYSFYQTNILRDHEDNVTCLLLVKDYLLSTSEDHSIRIWDLNTYALVHTYLMDDDRFWTISKSKHNNYITAGHDAGLIVFKLYKERPQIALGPDREKTILYYVWNNNLYASNLEKECESFTKELLHYSSTNGTTNAVKNKNTDMNLLYYKWLETNSNNNLVSNYKDHENKLVFQCPSGTYINQRTLIGSVSEERRIVQTTKLFLNNYAKDRIILCLMYKINKASYAEFFSYNRGQLEYTFKRLCNSAAFINATQILVLDKTLLIYNINGDLMSELNISSQIQNSQLGATAQFTDKDLNNLKVFSVTKDVLLFFCPKNQFLFLYSLNTKNLINSVNAPYGKLFDVIVNSYGFICCLFTNFVVIYDRTLNRITYKQQFNRIKSGVWDNNTSVIYSTYNQIHYLLINGSFGVLCTMASPTYLIKVSDGPDDKKLLYLINRQHRCFKQVLDSPDYLLKYSLLVNNMEKANTLVDSGQVFGRFTCSYLISNGKYVLARKLLGDDNLNKFYLSVQFGDLQNALNDAKLINNKAIWSYLGDVSLELGNVTIAELAYQKSKQYQKLTLLYLVIGDFGKLRKMLNICKIHDDKSLLLVHALYLGDMEELSNVLGENGHEQLANICNATYKINNWSEENLENPNAKYLVPPKPVNRMEGDMLNWNVKFIESDESKFDINEIVEFTKQEMSKKTDSSYLSTNILEQQMADLLVTSKKEKSPRADVYTPDQGVVYTKQVSRREEGPDLFNEILEGTQDASPLDFNDTANHYDGSDDIWDSVRDEVNHEQRLFMFLNQKNYTSALNYLNHMYGEVNVHLLKSTLQNSDFSKFDSIQQVNYQPSLNQKMNTALAHFQNAEFEQCEEQLVVLLRELFLYKSLNLDVATIMEHCYWYALAIRLEMERDSLSQTDPKRSLQLAAYLTCCKLNTSHHYLVLRKTVGLMWKAKNYQTAAMLVDRILNLDTSKFEFDQTEMDKAKKIHTLCLQKGTNLYDLDLQPEDFNNLEICSVTLDKLYQEPTATCLFCGAYAFRRYVNQFCKVCHLLKLV